MSIEITNESNWNIEPMIFSQLGVWVLDQMRVSIHSDLTIIFVEPDVIASLHERWMGLDGPTDVMSFPIDELRPCAPGEDELAEGILGDIVICPSVAHVQAQAAGHGTVHEMLLLMTHGILHLLGYDHASKEDEIRMFGIQRQLLLTFLAQREGSITEVSEVRTA